MFYVIYLITNERQLNQIRDVYPPRMNDKMISYIDQFVKKHYFENEFTGISSELLNEVEKELDSIYSTLNQNIKKTFKSSDINILELNLVRALNKKTLDELESVYELNPILSYLVKEDVFDRLADETIKTRCSELDPNRNLIIVATSTIIKSFKELLTKCKIHRMLYFKSDFRTPLAYMVYESQMIQNL